MRNEHCVKPSHLSEPSQYATKKVIKQGQVCVSPNADCSFGPNAFDPISLMRCLRGLSIYQHSETYVVKLLFCYTSLVVPLVLNFNFYHHHDGQRSKFFCAKAASPGFFLEQKQ